jgi:hypothetical protein
LATLAGGTEGNGPGKTDVDADRLREALDTGLFSSRGLNRLGWAHQTYAEFLAARFLHQHALPTDQLLQLVLHPDGSGKAVPQLRETAAWLASMEPAIFRALAKTDPETLLRSDVAGASFDDRAELVTNLLASFESGDLVEDWGLRQYYARLAHPGLVEPVRPFLQDPTRPTAARLAAVRIVQACKLTIRQADLVSIALDSAAPFALRAQAAAPVADIGDGEGRAALKPLAQGAGDDPEDELKGCALRAGWPCQLTAEELFTALTPPKNRYLTGSYRVFLRSDLLESLQAEDIGVALQWAVRQLPGNVQIDPLGQLASEILVRSLDHLDEPGIADLVAQALQAQCPHSGDIKELTERLQASARTRRLIARAMFPLVASDKHSTFTLVETCVLSAEDVPWLLSELDTTRPEGAQRLLSEAIVWLLNPRDVDAVDKVLRARHSNAFLDAAVHPRIAPVPLDMPTAREMKAQYENWHRHEREATARRPPQLVPDAKAIGGILTTGGAEAFYSIYLLLWSFIQLGTAEKPLAGWSGFEPALRTRILEAARKYLTEYKLDDGDEWWKHSPYPMHVIAASEALSLLCMEAPGMLHALSAHDWAIWARTVVCCPPIGDSEQEGVRGEILRAAYLKSPGAVLRSLGEIIDSENERRGYVYALRHFGGLWSDRIAELLRSKLRNGGLKPGSFRIVMDTLLKHCDTAARELAEEMLHDFPSGGSKRDSATASAQALIDHTADAAWRVVWPVLQADREFGMLVLRGSVWPDHPASVNLAAKLNENQLADLFLWLSAEEPEDDRSDDSAVTPEWAFARWRASLLDNLADRGTPAACVAIRRIISARPESKGLTWYLRKAEDLTRRNTWVPIPPEQLLQLCSDTTKRWIRNGADLIGVLAESLDRLQSLLQGETPAARFLWNELAEEVETGGRAKPVYRPKDESALSDYVKLHLHQDLKERGVIVNREVEIRRSFGGAPGERTDIHVDVAVPAAESNSWERVTVIVEVKGCWNKDLNHAMRTQLAERYMKETECRHGIYLVGWFDCAQWDPADRRRCPKSSIDAARQQFESQAATLSTGGIIVRAVVLNTALR